MANRCTMAHAMKMQRSQIRVLSIAVALAAGLFGRLSLNQFVQDRTALVAELILHASPFGSRCGKGKHSPPSQWLTMTRASANTP